MPKLTKKLIDDARASDGDIVLWDGTLPGFGVRVKASGSKAFIIQYRTKARRSRRYTIGRYGSLTLDQARREAQRLLGQIALGADPADQRQTIAQSATVRELAERYMRQHCAGRCKASTIRQHEWLLK